MGDNLMLRVELRERAQKAEAERDELRAAIKLLNDTAERWHAENVALQAENRRLREVLKQMVDDYGPTKFKADCHEADLFRHYAKKAKAVLQGPDAPGVGSEGTP